MAVTKSLITSYKYNGDTKPVYLIENHELRERLDNSSGSLIRLDEFTDVTGQTEFFNIIADYVGDVSALAIPYVDNPNYSPGITLLTAFFHNAYPVPYSSMPSTFNTVFNNINLYTGANINNVAWSCANGNTGDLGSYKTCVTVGSYFGSTNTPMFQFGMFIFDTGELDNDQIHVNSNKTTLKLVTFEYNAITFKLTVGSNNLFFISKAQAQALNNSSVPPYIPVVPGKDPYDPSGDGSGYSGSGGGPAPTGGTGTTGNGGLHDNTSDAIPTPSVPSNIATNSGLFTAYNPSSSQLADFGSALWSMDITDIDDVLKFLVGGDAFNAIIGLHLLPVQPVTGSTSSIKLGKWDSGVSAPKITNQYVQVSFGSVLLPEYWGNSIDYSPYTKVQLALPYIGIVDVETDDVLGSNNTLTYNIDVLSGAICATLHCVKGELNSVIYQWSGSCAVSLPVTGANYNGVLGSVLAIAAGAATIAVGGATIAGASGASAALASIKGGAAIAGGVGSLAGSALNTYGSVKGKVQKSGAFGANSGALGIMTPYFIVTRPVQSVPVTWQADKGYPSNISAQLGTLTGYTEVSEINLECSGTESEKEEIIKLLKSGVIF